MSTVVCTYLVRLELGVVQLPQGVLHVVGSGELDDSGSVLEHVGETHVSGLPHVILQILPRPRGGQPGHGHPVLRPSRRGTPITAPASIPPSGAAAPAPPLPVLGELDPQLVAVVVVSVPGV